jgi:CheY-like chemotaxis protein
VTVAGRPDGPRILVVEDEAMVAMLIEIIVSDAGCVVVGPIATVRRALETIERERVDAALLDVRVNGCQAYPVADALMARGIPFVFVSGFARKEMPANYRRCAYIAKPFQPDAILASLDKMIGRAGRGPTRAR